MGKNQFKKSRRGQQTQKRTRNRQILKMVGAVLGISVLSMTFVFAHDAITQLRYFRAENIVVTGMNRLSAKEILKQGDLGEAVNVLAVNLPLIRKRLCAHPWIDQADVARILPDRLEIFVQEHMPLAIIDTDPKMLMNTRGEIFKEWTSSDPASLPLVSGLRWSDLSTDSSALSRSFEAVITVLNMGESQASVIPRSALRRIEVDANIGLTLEAFDDIGAVKLGFGQYPVKYEHLRRLLSYLRQTGSETNIQWIDVQNPDRIIIHQSETQTVES
jgi:cell division protein FtsQ